MNFAQFDNQIYFYNQSMHQFVAPMTDCIFDQIEQETQEVDIEEYIINRRNITTTISDDSHSTCFILNSSIDQENLVTSNSFEDDTDSSINDQEIRPSSFIDKLDEQEHVLQHSQDSCSFPSLNLNLASIDNFSIQMENKSIQFSQKRKASFYKDNEDGRRVKKDALWKELLRRFRKHFRAIFEENGNTKGIYHWTDERLMKKICGILENFHIFEDSLSQLFDQTKSTNRIHQKNIVLTKVLLIIYPQKSKADLQVPQYRQIVNLVKPYCLDLFKNNNYKLLSKFFSDPVMNHLWDQYSQTEEYISYLSALTQDEQRLMKKDFIEVYNLQWPLSE